jgi:hypothetical protein
MNAMHTILEEFLQKSSPEQLRAELAKGNRPFFQTLTDSELVCFAPEAALPKSIPATVSFFRGDFAEDASAEEDWDAYVKHVANEEPALAA